MTANKPQKKHGFIEDREDLNDDMARVTVRDKRGKPVTYLVPRRRLRDLVKH